MSVFDVLRILFMFCTVGFSLAVIWFATKYVVHDRRRATFVNPLFSWAVHILVYYLGVFVRYVFFDPAPSYLFTTWSVVVRLHGVLSVLVLIYNLHIINGRDKEMYRDEGRMTAFDDIIDVFESRQCFKNLEE